MTFIKRFLRTLFRFVFRLSLVVGIIGLIGFIIWSEVLYQNGLTFLPSNTAPSTVTHQDSLRHAQWVALGGRGEIPTASLFPSHTFMRIAYHSVNRTPPKEKPPTDRVTLQTARLLMARDDKNLPQGKWHKAMMASAGWINKNWSMAQRLDTLLAESRSGLGCQGIDKTARRLLDKTAKQLTVEESALLVSIQTLPFSYLKRSQRVLDKANRVIKALKQNYPARYRKTKPLTMLPFTNGALKRAKLDCRR